MVFAAQPSGGRSNGSSSRSSDWRRSSTVRTGCASGVGSSSCSAVGGSVRPNAEELLKPTPESQPVRTVELRRQSEERADDPFDLPPEG